LSYSPKWRPSALPPSSSGAAPALSGQLAAEDAEGPAKRAKLDDQCEVPVALFAVDVRCAGMTPDEAAAAFAKDLGAHFDRNTPWTLRREKIFGLNYL
jgi:hypothetical protein